MQQYAFTTYSPYNPSLNCVTSQHKEQDIRSPVIKSLWNRTCGLNKYSPFLSSLLPLIQVNYYLKVQANPWPIASCNPVEESRFIPGSVGTLWCYLWHTFHVLLLAGGLAPCPPVIHRADYWVVLNNVRVQSKGWFIITCQRRKKKKKKKGEVK